MKVKNKILLLSCTYIIGVFLTWGYIINHRYDDWLNDRITIGSRRPNNVPNIKTLGSSTLWPAYWLGRGCLWITKPPKIPKSWVDTE